MEFLDLTMTAVFLEHQSDIYFFTVFGSKAPNKADFRVGKKPCSDLNASAGGTVV